MPSTKLSAADPALQEAWTMGKMHYEHDHPGNHLVLTATHRSVEEQAALYKRGRTLPGPIVTQLDGTPKHRSKHNLDPCRAIDFCVTIGGKVTWDVAEYEVAGPYFEFQGLNWGGRWPKFRDYPHIELPDTEE